MGYAVIVLIAVPASTGAAVARSMGTVCIVAVVVRVRAVVMVMVVTRDGMPAAAPRHSRSFAPRLVTMACCFSGTSCTADVIVVAVVTVAGGLCAWAMRYR